MDMLEEFQKLNSYQQALVAAAVLIDGREAVDILGADSENGAVFRALATEFGALDPELRICLMGTLLRKALDTLELGGLK
jgi:hypothetical protein